MQNVKQRYRYSAILLRELVITDFKLRYHGSVLGYIWSLLRPLALFAILYVVFVWFLRVGEGVPHYPIYLLLGIVLWNYFAEVTNNGVSAILGRGDLIRKINFPKYVIVLSGSLSALINLGINLVVVALFMVVFGTELQPAALIFVPLLIIQLFVLALGVAFLLSALYVKFRDIGYIWEVFMQGAFYATPILYPVTYVMEKAYWAAQLQMLNPMAQIVQDIRYYMVTTDAITIHTLFDNPLLTWLPVVLSGLIFWLGATYFKRQSRYFAEKV
ncbi:ABC transporter permease [Candidatus Saccharibacteria bacterium]|nr:ABC transporter permease [Candidatus Saccharibacteria bacterium]